MLATKHPRGFIALISAIVVSFVLLVAVVTLGMRGITGRLYLLDLERKISSQALAESCVAIATIKIANDPEYGVSNFDAQVGDDVCTILSVAPNTPNSSQATLKTRGVKDGATTYLHVVIDEVSGDVVSWKETPDAP